MTVTEIVVFAALAILIWGTTFARWRFHVSHSEVPLLPKGSKPIRVLHISDIHLAPWQRGKIKFLGNLADLEPDLIVSTGDILGHRDVIAIAIESLESLLDVPGVFVNGSNDYYAPTMRNPIGYIFRPSEPTKTTPLATTKFTDALEARGWKNLNNRAATISLGELSLGFLGLDDPHDKLDDLSTLPAQRKSIGKADLIFGVAHAPYRRVIEAMAEQDVSLLFAGHTHGGQVRLPGVGALTTNSDLPNKHAKGLSAWAWGQRMMLLNVSAGLGNSIFAPVRFWNRPEVSLLTLVERRD